QQDIMCKNAELGYWLSEEYWGNGIVPKVVSQLVDYGFRNFDITRIYARPFGNNPSSQRVLEKCGFKLEARIEKSIFKNGEFLDELIYAVRKS
ncbi:MAG TPA: GNAT family protein, partial [Bacteroidia bacterium]|nr:GNAT family protein [Bacteroidia bacterium]